MTNPTPHGQEPEALRQAAWLKRESASCQRHYDLGVLIERQHTRIAELQARIKTMAEEHADELLVAHLDGMRAAPSASYSPDDRAFHQFWYSHMSEDLMQPPLIGIPYFIARYIWDAALRPAHVQKPAEIEHVADDVSKNGAELNMTCASHGQAPSQAVPACKDSTPELHVGDSAFESWYSTYSPAHKGDKQRARDAYVAGMGPLVTAAPTAVAGPSEALAPGKQHDDLFPPLPTPDLRDVGTTPKDIQDFLRGYATEYALTALTARAPADSVLEDAARYRWLREHRSIDLHANPSVPWVVRCEFQPIPTTTAIVGEALDAAIDAARKQGETNEH